MTRKTELLLSVALGAGVLAASGAWAGEQSIARFATMPDGAEVTGLSLTALGEIFLNAQHPGGKNTYKDGVPPALLGYIDGFADGTGYDGPGMDLPPEDARDTVAVAAGRYVTLARAGEMLGSGEVLGGVYDTSGKLMYVSNAPDFNGFVPLSATEAYLYTAWEGAGRDGAGAISRLTLTRVDGTWQADLAASRMVDLSGIDGGQVLCSGVVTPWGTPLIAEEYFFYNTAMWNHPDNYDADEKPGFAGGNDTTYIKPLNMKRYMGRMANPYRYGYMIEINYAATESGEMPVKRYATGRLSHEIVAVMPDMRTLYMTDDDSAVYSDKVYNTASGGVLFKFVADRRGDLSAGTLYAARLKQDAGDDPHTTGFDVSWIRLGHASEREIAGWIADYDGIEVSDYVDGRTSYISDDEIRAYAEMVSGKDLNGDGTIATAPDARAAFLESRRTAAALGATNEWDKLEGITTQGNKVYLSASGISFTMDKSWGVKDWSTGEIDKSSGGDIALVAEKCGGTYVAETGDDYNITRLDPFVIGRTDAEGRCDANLPANPDNILALADGRLLIGEDAGKKKHDLDMIWLVK